MLRGRPCWVNADFFTATYANDTNLALFFTSRHKSLVWHFDDFFFQYGIIVIKKTNFTGHLKSETFCSYRLLEWIKTSQIK